MGAFNPKVYESQVLCIVKTANGARNSYHVNEKLKIAAHKVGNNAKIVPRIAFVQLSVNLVKVCPVSRATPEVIISEKVA